MENIMLNETSQDQLANTTSDIQALLDTSSTKHTATRRTALKVALGVGYTAAG
jgi:hypothetical protein